MPELRIVKRRVTPQSLHQEVPLSNHIVSPDVDLIYAARYRAPYVLGTRPGPPMKNKRETCRLLDPLDDIKVKGGDIALRIVAVRRAVGDGQRVDAGLLYEPDSYIGVRVHRSVREAASFPYQTHAPHLGLDARIEPLGKVDNGLCDGYVLLKRPS